MPPSTGDIVLKQEAESGPGLGGLTFFIGPQGNICETQLHRAHASGEGFDAEVNLPHSLLTIPALGRIQDLPENTCS